MKLLKNTASERVIDELSVSVKKGSRLDVATPDLSVFAFGELKALLQGLEGCRLITSSLLSTPQSFLGSESDRAARNNFATVISARDFSEWIEKGVEVKAAPGVLPQAAWVVRESNGTPVRVVSGNCPMTTSGLETVRSL